MRKTLVIAFAVLAVAADTPPPAATVNGDVIPLSAVDAVAARRAGVSPVTPAEVRELRLAIVEELVDDLLLAQHVRKNAPELEAGELDAHMRAVEKLQRDRGLTLADFARETGQTEAQLRAAAGVALRFEKLVDAKTTDDDLKAFHAARKDHFDGVSVRISHIVLRLKPDATAGERSAARKTLAGLKADIAAGKLTFAAAAKKVSICASAAAGGDLGFVKRNDPAVEEPVAAAAFALKVGEMADPVESSAGAHLVTVTERKPGTPRPFEQVRDAVRDAYADDFRQALVAKLRAEGKITVSVPGR